MYGERYDAGYAEGVAAYNAREYDSKEHAANELAPPPLAGLASLHWSEDFKRGWTAAAQRYWADRTPVRLRCNGVTRGHECAERAEFVCSWRGQDCHYCLAHRVALDEIVWRNLEHSGEMVREDGGGLTPMYDGPKWGLVNSPPLP